MNLPKTIAVAAIVAFASHAQASVSVLQVPESVLKNSGEPDTPVWSNQGAGDGGKSTSRATLYSAVLPGWGHYYLGQKRTAVTFFAIEAAVWTSFVAFEVQGRQREDGYQQYSRTFAGVSQSGHSDDYYSILTSYNSFQDYEDKLKREGRFALYPDAGAAELERYFVNNRVADYEPWVWQSVEHRRTYQDRRSASKRAYRRGTYALAAAAANRVAAIFFAIRSGWSMSRETPDAQNSLRFEFGPPGRRTFGEVETGVSVIKRF